MLSEEVIEKVTERLVKRMERANLFVIKKIARKIKEIGEMMPSNAHDILQIMDYGGDIKEIVRELAKETQLNQKDIYKIFEDVAKNDQNFAKKFYEYKNKKFIPWEENELLRREVDAIAEMTNQKYLNMSRTRGIGYTVKDKDGNVVFKDVSTLYRDTVDEAIVSISQGKTTYDDEMKKLMKQIGRSGLKYVDYESGYRRRLDSALRMNLNDGLKQLHNKTQEIFGREFDSDGVEITVHGAPAPDHEKVQGRQFSTVKPNEYELSEWEKFQSDKDCYSYDGTKFPAISEETGRDRRSISEYNCKHYTFAIVLGVSKPQYSEEQLQKIIDDNETGFDYEGKHYTLYEGTQLQRKIETEIRSYKDMQIMGVESGNKELAEESQSMINKLVGKYYEVSNAGKLPTELDRIQVEGYREIEIKESNNQDIENKLKKNNVTIGEEFTDGSIDKSLSTRTLKQLDNLIEKYPVLKNKVKNDGLSVEIEYYGYAGGANVLGDKITLSKGLYENKDKFVALIKEGQDDNWSTKINKKDYDIYTITHETAHVLEDAIIQQRIQTREKFDINDMYWNNQYYAGRYRSQEDVDIFNELFVTASEELGTSWEALYKEYISDYGKSENNYEWFAELFTKMELGEQDIMTERLKKYLEEELWKK